MMTSVHEDFASPLASRWRRYLVGNGALECSLDGATLRFVNHDTTSRQYTNAQLDDYQGLPRRRFPWRPPLRLTVRARFSHSFSDLSGTAGFGFWNDPFMMTERRVPTLPRALWFFYGSSPSDMKIDMETPGQGWKAATIDALRPVALLLAPIALPAALLMNVRPLYRAIWPPVQRALNVCEAAVETSMTAWHTYVIAWREDVVAFSVDGEPVLEKAPAPHGPLGFVIWLDNQYMIVKPWIRFGWGLLGASGRQWLEVSQLAIEPWP